MKEIQFPSFGMLVFLFFSSTFILFFFKLGSLFKSSANLPPGPWKLPLIGNLHNLIVGSQLPHRALHQLALKYGPLMHLQLGEVSAVVVSSPEAAELVMKTHDLSFASRPRTVAAEIMNYEGAGIGFGPYGELWRQLRKICALELMSTKRVQSFRSLREEVFLDLARWIGSMEGSAVNLTEKLYSTTYALVARAAVGEITKERERLLPIMKEVVLHSAGFDIADVYPSIKLFQRMSTAMRRLSVLSGEADKILENIICDHRVAKKNDDDDDDDDDQEDLVDVLLRYQEDGLELPLTNNSVKAVIFEVLMGGSETSTTTMDWAMSEMLKNPNILERAQEEVRKVFDDKGCSRVDESYIHELKYLKAAIKETLRMHPALPLLLPRKCMETCEINGYQIPVDTKMVINGWAINRDSRYWKDGERFHPERFLQDSAVDFKGNHFEFIPFGAGRRICPGMTFGLANVELPLAMMLYHFDWTLPAGEEVDMKEGFGITTKRVNNLCVVPALKRPLPTQ